MMKKLAGALLSLSVLTVSACGFSPVYSTVDAENNGSIQILQIDGYAGHAMRNELILLLRPGIPGVESGTLEVDYRERTQDFPVRTGGLSVRSVLQTTANYRLITSEGELQGRVVGEAASAPDDSPYADIASRRENSSKAARDAATKIYQDLIRRVGTGESFREISED